MKGMDYGGNPGKNPTGPVHKTEKKPNQKTKGASVKSGLSEQSQITKKTSRGETSKGQRPYCKPEKASGPYTFKA